MNNYTFIVLVFWLIPFLICFDVIDEVKNRKMWIVFSVFPVLNIVIAGFVIYSTRDIE